MYVRLWRFRARAESAGAFLEAYGPNGLWARLFATAPGFLGTDLLLAADSPLSYLTIDRWVNRDAWLSFLQRSRAAYEELDRATETLLSDETEIGEFSTVD